MHSLSEFIISHLCSLLAERQMFFHFHARQPCKQLQWIMVGMAFVCVFYTNGNTQKRHRACANAGTVPIIGREISTGSRWPHYRKRRMCTQGPKPLSRTVQPSLHPPLRKRDAQWSKLQCLPFGVDGRTVCSVFKEECS